MRKLLAVLLLILVPAATSVGADAVFGDGYDRWYIGSVHLAASGLDTLNPSFTPSEFYIDADSLDIHIQLKTAGSDTTYAPVANVYPLDDGEGIRLPFRVDYVVIRSTGDAGRVRYVFAGHSD